MNKPAQFTPGPWVIDEDGRMIEAQLPNLCNEYEHICDLRGDRKGQINIGNAHLIAAAPVMYEALEHAAMSCHHPACKCKGEYASQPERYCTCHVQKARQALAQAEGK